MVAAVALAMAGNTSGEAPAGSTFTWMSRQSYQNALAATRTRPSKARRLTPASYAVRDSRP
jgi:hypothetical protein